jgi:hypothetical protein
MKRLTACPYCHSPFTSRKVSTYWYKQYCQRRCAMDYFQNFNAEDDEEIGYITFNTKNFNLYVYYNRWDYKNIAHIYSSAELAERGKASPILKLPADKIDIYDLEALDIKLSTLALFT